MVQLTFDKVTQEDGHMCIHLRVDGLISDLEVKYRRKRHPKSMGKGHLYWGQHVCGLVRFFSHSPDNESGSGGRTEIVKMVNGKQHTVKGVWSSRASVMNEFFPDTVEVEIMDDERFNYSSAVRISVLKKLLPAQYHLGWKRREYKDSLGITEKQYRMHTFGGPLDGEAVY